jgi:hypothetical protein
MTEYANKQELIQCITREGEKLDVILPRPDEREFGPAGLITDQL